MTSSAYSAAEIAAVRKLRQVRRRTEYSDREAYSVATSKKEEIHAAVFRRWENFKRTGIRAPENVEPIDPEARRNDPWAQPPDDTKATPDDRDLHAVGPTTETALKSVSKPLPKRGPRPAPKF